MRPVEIPLKYGGAHRSYARLTVDTPPWPGGEELLRFRLDAEISERGWFCLRRADLHALAAQA